jgi:hypothetical protein
MAATSTSLTNTRPGLPLFASALSIRACATALAASAVAIVAMQYAIITHSDIEGLLRLKAAQGAMAPDEIDALVARQVRQLRYAPLMSLLFWPLCVLAGAGAYAAALRAIGGPRFVFVQTLRAFVIGIAAAYGAYAVAGAALAVATGETTVPNGADVFFAQASLPLKTMLQTFDLANLGAAVLAGFLVFRTIRARKAAFVVTVVCVLGVYAGAKAALVAMTAPADQPVACELCKLSAEPGEPNAAGLP